MKVARNNTHGLRHDWLSAEDEQGKVQVSLMAHRNQVCIDVTIDGVREEKWVSLRWLAAVLAKGIHEENPV